MFGGDGIRRMFEGGVQWGAVGYGGGRKLYFRDQVALLKRSERQRTKRHQRGPARINESIYIELIYV